MLGFCIVCILTKVGKVSYISESCCEKAFQVKVAMKGPGDSALFVKIKKVL